MSGLKKRRPLLVWVAFFVCCFLVYFGGKQALTHPETPLPDEWNPLRPLDVAAPVTLLTQWKLAQTIHDPSLCLAALSEVASYEAQEDRVESEQCYIRNRVILRSVNSVRINPLETSCPIALRLAIWEQQALSPLAVELLGAGIAQIHHIGSYNCRPIRTTSGESVRMSTHATADAVDIAGVTLLDGRRISLIDDWQSEGAQSAFLRRAHETSCKWFKTSLGPEFNSLHANHFHLQNVGWGTCR